MSVHGLEDLRASPKVKAVVDDDGLLRVCRFRRPDLGVGVGLEWGEASDSTSVVASVSISSAAEGRERVDKESGGVSARSAGVDGEEEDVRLVDVETVYLPSSDGTPSHPNGQSF